MNKSKEAAKLRKLMKKVPLLFEYQARTGTVSEHQRDIIISTREHKAKRVIKVNVDNHETS